MLLVNRYQREMLDSFPSCNTRKSGVTLLITKGFYTGKAQTMPVVSVTVIIPEWQFNDGEEKSHICFSSEPIRSIQQKAWAAPDSLLSQPINIHRALRKSSTSCLHCTHKGSSSLEAKAFTSGLSEAAYYIFCSRCLKAFIATMKTKGTWEGEGGSIWLPHHNLLPKEVRTELEQNRNLGGGSWC